MLPTVLGPADAAGEATVLAPGALVAAGTGDNMAAALGLHAEDGDVVLSIGTSGVACAVAADRAADPTGTVAGFSDATGRYLPLVCTLNAARVLDAGARLLGVSHAEFSDLALAAPAGADGLVLVPYLEGERTPALPDATGSLHGLTLATMTPAAPRPRLRRGRALRPRRRPRRAARLRRRRARVVMVGGGARSLAVRTIAPQVLGLDVLVPPEVEAVADGAARQAAWALTGELPHWGVPGTESYAGDVVPAVRERYAAARAALLDT